MPKTVFIKYNKPTLDASRLHENANNINIPITRTEIV